MLYLPHTIVNGMIQHCLDDEPKEACGILMGPKGQPNRASRMQRMRNTQDSPTAFAFDPEEQLSLWREMQEEAMHPVAVYHSHPAHEPYPSERDIDNAHYPDMYHVIISLRNDKPELRCFTIRNRQVTEERMLDAW